MSEAQPRSGWWWRPVRMLILLIAILALLFWQKEALQAWVTSLINGTLALFGWGLLFILMALGILIGLGWRRKLLVIIRRWNRWLGGVAFVLMAWGILAFFPGEGFQRVGWRKEEGLDQNRKYQYERIF